ncbi:MAG: glycosyltransferase family 1 protein [Proteobacteria bacterium]|nr:glycosyltransferase family 1 protein [Pseudomonadota bacterium]
MKPDDGGGAQLRILVVSDAWKPQINGVVRSLEALGREAGQFNAAIDFLTPEGFRTFALPTYPEIRMSMALPGKVSSRLAAARPHHIHIATEGPLGILARRHCLRSGLAFTTSYHTRFPEYVSARLPVPESWSYAALRRFHNAGNGIFVSTASLEAELAGRGFKRLMRWTRGVDTRLYTPARREETGLAGPVMLYVGRIAVEKNLEAFLSLDVPGTKVLVGDGPAKAELEARFPEACFLGLKEGEALARIYASADVFVFPSLTDTFGIVLIEALASGLPIAAFPVTGPLDVVGKAPVGMLDLDLAAAIRGAMTFSRADCVAHARHFTWQASVGQFIANIRHCMAERRIAA